MASGRTASPAKQEDAAATSQNAHSEPYTAFSDRQRHMIIALQGISMLASPLTATMYLPLLPILSDHFNVSNQDINLTITVYIIFQAIAPLLLAGTSDYSGRRPVFLLCFGLYTLASLGLALNTSSFAGLIVLRALQSLGASAILSVSYGTIADISMPAERGKLLGPLLTASNVGTCIGPIIGGAISYGSHDFVWAFWSLFIFASMMLFLLAVFLPETARNVVGNGSIPEKRWNQPLWKTFHRQQRLQIEQSSHQTSVAQHKLNWKSPLTSIFVLFHPDTFLVILVGAGYYSLWYCIQASIPHIYGSIYGFNEIQIGLAYIPGAVAVILGMYLSGVGVDYNYERTARKHGIVVEKNKKTDLRSFPVERARTIWCTRMLLLSFGIMVGYGWSIVRRVHVSVPLILQCIQGFLNCYVTQCYSVLLVDGYPETPSTASTAGNMTRCALSAIALAVLEPARKAVGYGWVMSFLGLVTGIGGFGAQSVVRKWGIKWRNERQEKGRQRDLEKASHGREGDDTKPGSLQVPDPAAPSEKRSAEREPISASR